MLFLAMRVEMLLGDWCRLRQLLMYGPDRPYTGELSSPLLLCEEDVLLLRKRNILLLCK